MGFSATAVRHFGADSQTGVTSMDKDEQDMVCSESVGKQLSFCREVHHKLKGAKSDAAIIPLQALGVVDVAGNNIPDEDLFAHVLSNTTEHHSEDYTIQRSSAFMNEYPWEDETNGQRSDGGPSDPHHLLGCFTELFPYGAGGFKVDRVVPVPYEKHAQWALQYADWCF